MTRFHDRQAAGRALASALEGRGFDNPLVLALPRGGVPIGAEIARALGAPMDLVMVRKIGVPRQPELAAAAIVNGDDPQLVVNQEIAAMAGLSADDIDALAQTQLEEIRRRRGLYLQGQPEIEIRGRTAIVVDDGIATGATVRAALKATRQRGAARLVLAVPVAPQDTLTALQGEVDEIVCLQTPEFFYAIGAHYVDFAQVPDAEVIRLMQETRASLGGAGKIGSPPDV